MSRICHLSSAHTGLDVRVFHKECVSLAAAGYDTHLVINATQHDVDIAENSGVTVHLLSAAQSRTARMFKQAWRCYKTARALNADLYHFHDPELIPYGLLFKLAGKRVIYDVHEDLPRDIMSKEWIPLRARRVVSLAAGFLEYFVSRFFFSVVTATPFIAERFQRANPSAVDINNYPIHQDFEPASWDQKKAEVCYVGNIGRVRGIDEIVSAIGMAQSDARLALYGNFRETDVREAVSTQAGWHQVDEYGFVDRSGVRAALDRAVAGLVTLHPLPNYVDALPVKMFEYMAAGLPVIASNFPCWEEIVHSADCGLCVDPLNPKAIANAIDFFIENPNEAQRMGENGRRAILERYNWQHEQGKLLALYDLELAKMAVGRSLGHDS